MDSPVIFTITKEKDVFYKVYTRDPRGAEYNLLSHVDRSATFGRMQKITRELNDKGYAVLFEVD